MAGTKVGAIGAICL